MPIDQGDALLGEAAQVARNNFTEKVEIKTATGLVRFLPAHTTWYKFSDAIVRLHDLHLRSVGENPVVSVEEAISVDLAQSLFRLSCSSMVLQAAHATTEERLRQIEQLVLAAEALGSRGGLESIFVSLFAGLDEADEAIALQAASRWAAIKSDSRAGAGFASSIGYNARVSGFFGFEPADFDHVLVSKQPVRTAQDFYKARLTSQAGITEAQCENAFILFGVVGGALAGSPGGPAGVGVGGSVGGGRQGRQPERYRALGW